MKGKQSRSFLLMGLAVITALVFTYSDAAFAADGSDYKSKINSIKEQQEQNKDELNKSEDKLEKNKSQQEDVSTQISQIKNDISKLSTKIENKQNEVNKAQDQIKDLQDTIKETTDRINERDALLKKRIQTMYIHGGSIDYIEVLLGSNSFGNFISRVAALKTIADNDQKILNEQKDDKAKLSKQKQLQEQKLEQVKADLAELNTMKKQLDEKKAEQNKLLGQLKQKQGEIEDLVTSKEEEAEILKNQKAAAEKAYQLYLEEEKKRKEAEAAAAASAKAKQKNTSSSSTPNSLAYHSGSGVLGWPVDGGYVTSGYGYRSYGGGEFHPGIDIGSGGKSVPIHAAADGVVFVSHYSSSYGNVIYLTSYINGQKMTTVYAHMASRTVGENVIVHRGDVIGYMGATGAADGVHLHFEVYKGDWTPPPHPGTVNPLNYLN